LLFAEEYRALRPRAPIPSLEIRFRRFTSLNTTIRLREGRVHVHLSDLLEGAPESVLRAIAHILLAKLYRKPLNARANHSLSQVCFQRSGDPADGVDPPVAWPQKMLGPQGQHYNLDEVLRA
jgi:hypothetical protein